MHTLKHREHDFRLIDLLVAFIVSGAILGFVFRGCNAARVAARRTECADNMRQIGLALLNFSSSRNRFPNAGTFLDDPSAHQGDPARSTIARSIADPASFQGTGNPWMRNWVVDILPYLETSGPELLWDDQHSFLSPARVDRSAPSNLAISSTSLGVLRCPDDPTATAGQGNLSYVVNGGFSRWHAIPVGWVGGKADGQSKNGGVLQWTDRGSPWKETQRVSRKLGVMFLGTSTGDQPWDIATSPNDLTDGASATLLLAENTLAGSSRGTPYSGGYATNWACPLPNFSMFIASDDVCRTPRSTTDCLSGSLRPTAQGRDGPGWGWANRPGTHENVGYGQHLSIEGSFPLASSGHAGGGNFVFCDGATRFLSDSIDGTVYARLISSAGTRLPAPLHQRPLSPDAFDQ